MTPPDNNDLFNQLGNMPLGGEPAQSSDASPLGGGDPLSQLLGGLLGGSGSAAPDLNSLLGGLLGGGTAGNATPDLNSLLGGLLGGGAGALGTGLGGSLPDLLGGLLGGGAPGTASPFGDVVNGLMADGLDQDSANGVLGFVLGKLSGGRAPGEANLHGILDMMDSGQAIQTADLRNAGLTSEVMAQTGLDEDTANRSLIYVLENLQR